MGKVYFTCIVYFLFFGQEMAGGGLPERRKPQIRNTLAK